MRGETNAAPAGGLKVIASGALSGSTTSLPSAADFVIASYAGEDYIAVYVGETTSGGELELSADGLTITTGAVFPSRWQYTAYG